jgi:FkbM family methyltransferase
MSNVRQVNFFDKSFVVEATTEHEQNFWELYNSKKWEQEYLKFMTSNVNGQIFVDIGSWIGPVSLLMSNYYDQIIAFDLDAVANNKFKKNIGLNNIKNIALFEMGFSDKAGTLQISADKLGHSVTSIYGNKAGKQIDVNVVRLDTFLKSFPDNKKIGFIKIDCEGAEYKFLSQVYRFIKRRRVKVLISYHPFVLKKPGYYFVKLRHWFSQLPFQRIYFTKDGKLVTRKPYQPLFKLVDNFPMADVIISN